jgi:hypothetical protein
MAAGRLFYYTIPLQILVLPRAVEAMPAPWARRAALGTLLAGMAAMLALWLALSPYSRCLSPYRSYLQQPQALIGRELPQPMCVQPSG